MQVRLREAEFLQLPFEGMYDNFYQAENLRHQTSLRIISFAECRVV
jgi:hypothetical protein